MGVIRQIAYLDMPDGAVGHGGFGWGTAFPLATLPGSAIFNFQQIAATNLPVINGLTDSNTNAHTLLDNLRNTSNGAEFWSIYKLNCPSIARGFSGRVGSGTSTTLTDDTLTQRGITWATDEWQGLSYINFDSGWTGTVTSNTATTLTISGMGGTPQAFEFYAIGGYMHTTITGSGDFFAGISVEMTGVSTSAILGHDKVQNSFTSGNTITVPAAALGSQPATIIACSLCDVNLAGTPGVGAGFTDDGSYMKWNQVNKMARLEHQLLSNPGTAGATFSATATDHYQALYIAIQDVVNVGWSEPLTSHPGRSPGRAPASARFFQVPRAYTAPSTAVNAALTGQAATFTAGLLTPSTTVPLVGQSGTFSAGTMAPATTVPLVGQSDTFAAGTLTPSTTVPVTGQQATFTAGALTPSTTVPVSGQSATFTPGTLAPSTSVPLLGQAATFTPGTVTPGLSISLTGSFATFNAGFMSALGGDASLGFIPFPGNPSLSSPSNALQFNRVFSAAIFSDVTLPLTGQAAAFVAGTMAPSTTVPLAGQPAAFTAGTVTPGLSLSLSGSLASFSAGILTPSTTVALAGQSAAFTPGQMTPGISQALTGQAITFSAGSMTPSTSGALAGQSATFTPGTMTPSGGDPPVGGPQVTIVYFIANVGTLMQRQ